MRSRCGRLSAVVLGVTLLCQNALSQEAGLTSGSRTLARDGLFFAGTDGMATAFANPAGIVYLAGRAVELAIVDQREQFEYESSTQGLFRSYRDDNFSFAGGAYWTVLQRVTAALTYHRPLDYQVNWPFALAFTKDVSTSLAAFSMFNRIQIEAISPSLGIRFDKVAIGLTANAYRLRQHAAFPLANKEWFQDRGEAAYQFEYKQDAWTHGFNLGMMATLSEKLRVGGTVRSAYDATLEGEAISLMMATLDSAATQTELSANFEMPWILGAGLVYQLGGSWEMNLDAAYGLWSNTQNSLDFKFSDSNWQNRLAEVDTVTGIRGSSFPLTYDNSLTVGVGFEYSPPQGLIYRAGYRFNQSPNSPGTYSMLFPNVDQHWLSFGIGYNDGYFSIDASLAYAFGISAAVDATENSGSPGRYDSNTLVPAVRFAYKF